MTGSLGAAAAALLWKEQGVTVLAVSAVYDLCVVHRLRLREAIMLVLKVRCMFVIFRSFELVGYYWGQVRLKEKGPKLARNKK